MDPTPSDTNPPPEADSRLTRRERRAIIRQAFGTRLLTTFATLLTVVTALVFVVSGVLIHETAHRALESELGRRLEDVAALAAHDLRDEALHPSLRDTRSARRHLSDAIHAQQAQLGVSALVVFTLNENEPLVLASTREVTAQEGEVGRLLADMVAIERALEAQAPSSSSLYRDPLQTDPDGSARLLKSGYAPVLQDGEPVAVVGVELPAEFRTAAQEVAWRFIILGTLAGLAVLLTAVFLVRQRVHVPIYRLVRSMRGAEDGAPQPARVRWNDEIGVLTGHYNDMVDRLAAKDRELRTLYGRAREQADYLQGYSNYLVAGVPLGVAAVDDQGRLSVWNPGAERILRQAGQLGQPLEDQLDEDHPLRRALCAALHSGSITSQAMLILEEEGEQRLVELSCAPFRGDQGELLGAAALVDDRTELEQLRRAASRNERLAAIGNLGAGLAHEIKNPLGAISGFAELIQRKEGADAARLAGRLRDEVLELDRFLKEFLAFAREDRIRREPCDLNELVLRGVELGVTGMGLNPAEASALLGGETVEHQGHELKVELDLARDLQPVAVDLSLIRSVCANLAANAFQAMKTGGTLRIRTARSAKQVTIRFRDHGPGVPLGDRERIFDPLFTTRAEGTGLGLAITAKAINAHGGEIVARDAAGGGAEFVIRLPVVGVPVEHVKETAAGGARS